MLKIGFIGLGVMGFPMAGHLATQGNQVVVFNRTQSKAELWAQSYKGKVANTPMACAQDADFVFCCVGNDDDLNQVTIGENGAFHTLKQGAIFTDHTTASATMAKLLAQEASKRGAHFLDAPVSGGQVGAENGALSIMVGGDADAFSRVEKIMQAYGTTITHMGEAGSGQLTKMANQICIAGILQSLSEAVNFSKKAGLDCEKAFETIAGGAAGSWQLANRHKTMLKGEYEFGFAVDWMRKDLGIVMEQAKQIGAQVPIAEQVDQFYAEVQEMGGNRWDTSSLLARLEK